ncbi:uncharacterized protein LOC103318072 isoform X2 [Nasonia vitripennis]|uniref:Uncharacterized protein n=1 Tax=Nasonia vitripennis TaxID=7425 RepID=A0A7M7IU01_NASVI|nr:uncharacterized protein LOC103318072 isoform X2 [Nasonia vitripennis]
MDNLFTKETNHLWQYHEHFGLGCKENDDIDDDFVLKFSTDESDCDDATHSNDNYTNSPIIADDDLAMKCNARSSMQKNVRLSTYALRDDNTITNTTHSAKWSHMKSKVMKNQRSVLTYLRQRDIPDDQVANKIKKDPNPDLRSETQKLTRQLPSARVILERLPDSLMVKNGKLSDNDCQGIQTKRCCAGCDRTCLKRGRCLVCNSVLKNECAKCGNRFSSYNKHRYHLELKCSINAPTATTPA